MKSSFLILFFISTFFPFIEAQQLEYFITKGLQNSPLLNDYSNQLQAANADSLLVKAAQMPQVNSRSQVLYAPSFHYFGYDNVLTNGGNYGSVVDVSQYIFNRRVLQNKYESVSIQKRDLLNTSKISSGLIRKEITNQYITAFTDYQDLKNCERYLELLNEHKNILHLLVDQAVYKQSDYYALIIECQSSEIEISQLQTQIKTDEYVLKQLCGITDTGTFIPEIPVLKRVQTVNTMNVPLFMQFKIDSLKIGNEKQTVALNYAPKFNWYADAGLLSVDPLLLYRHLGFSVGVSMSFPIFDGHQRILENKKLDYKENTRSNYERYFKNQYTGQIRQLNDALMSTQKSLEMMKKQLQSTKELAAMLKSLLNNGNASIIELINNMKNYQSASRNMNRLEVREFEIVNELNYLMSQE
jgi:outer membrane protein TolC